ncbi:hypothetical protein HMPREF0970_00280 [Schaalia odontolytica F0309]|uniref:Uncharacterized protein n=1 Tax=Schaalia odontolytica F0309 TaxID=649742 RepID=D4TWH0_9ACTO|nr:hypothetical protein HMPREF0970_00280 [Schaalia odontolytica F0309]
MGRVIVFLPRCRWIPGTDALTIATTHQGEPVNNSCWDKLPHPVVAANHRRPRARPHDM